MRLLLASLIVMAVLYLWDANYNNGVLLGGLQSIGRSIAHSRAEHPAPARGGAGLMR